VKASDFWETHKINDIDVGLIREIIRLKLFSVCVFQSSSYPGSNWFYLRKIKFLFTVFTIYTVEWQALPLFFDRCSTNS
jgi:hypothetical protein